MSGHHSFGILRNEKTMSRSISDSDAMEEITHWINDNDPTLTGDIPNWVWDLVSLLDDLIDETGRNA